MTENRNDQQFGQTRSGQYQNRDSQEGKNREGTSSGSQMDRELYEEDDPNILWDQEQNEGSQPSQGRTSGSSMNREWSDERGTNPTSAQQGNQRRDEYASPDDFDELEDDELEDDEMISRVDVEDDMDILDEDENPRMNRPNL